MGYAKRESERWYFAEETWTNLSTSSKGCFARMKTELSLAGSWEWCERWLMVELLVVVGE